MKQNITRSILAVACLSLVIPQGAFAARLIASPVFNPNQIVTDFEFTNTQSFSGPDGIQKFLESKNSVLANTTPAFLSKLHEPDNPLLKLALDDPRPDLGRQRTAAELIWDASKSAGINPQVILVTLNKEQSLIEGRQNDSADRLQRALDRALGFACPDSGGCGSLFLGFYYQLFGNLDTENNRYLGAVKSLMKSFTLGRGPSINGRISQVGESVYIENTTGDYTDTASQYVTIGNRATAALYRFTPHVFNGNYNFWKFFKNWFRLTNGVLVRIDGQPQLYLIQDGQRQLVPDFVVSLRGLDLATVQNVAQEDVGLYPEGKILGPKDNVLVKTASGGLFMFMDNQKYTATDFSVGSRGLSKDIAITASDSDLALFQSVGYLLPPDGNMVKSDVGSDVYIVVKGVLQKISSFVFKQRNLSQKDVKVVPDKEFVTYKKDGFFVPIEHTYVKGASGQVYYIEQALKQKVSDQVLKTRKVAKTKINTVSQQEVDGYATGTYADPANGTVYKVASTGELYFYKNSSSHRVYPYVAKQRRFAVDITVTAEEHAAWASGVPIPPSDGTIVKSSNNPAVYLVSQGQLRLMSSAIYKKRKIKSKNVVSLPPQAIEDFAKGDPLTK